MLLIVGWVNSASVSAHASLLGTTPSNGSQLETSPTEILLDFSEPVGVVDGGTVLHGSDIEPIMIEPDSRGAQVVIPLENPLDDGAYILQWRVISADSHPISGTVSFTVGDAEDSTVSVAETNVPVWIEWMKTAAVSLKYVGLLTALGVLLVGWRIVPAEYAAAARLVRWFAGIGSIGVVEELPFAAMVQQDRTITDVSELWSATGALDSGLLLAALISVVAVVLTVVTPHLYRGWLLPTALMLVAVLTLLLSGHTRSREPMWLMMVSDAAHVITGSIWIGGILLLTLGLRGKWKGEGFSTADSSFAAVSRFSTMAGFTAGIVALSGVAMAIMILDSWDALFNTRYGVTLLIKIGLVVVVLLLAAANRFWLLPGKKRTRDSSISWLRRIISVELVVLIAIAAVTGSLVQRNPNVQADITPAEQSAIIVHQGEHALDANHTLRLKIVSTPSHQVSIVATIIDDDRNIVLPETPLELSWFLPDRDLGPLTQELTIDSETGAYTGVFTLPSSGLWELGIRANLDRFTDSRTTVEVAIPD